jgi:RNA polymerase sigma-70 factor (ECF subfamily)
MRRVDVPRIPALSNTTTLSNATTLANATTGAPVVALSLEEELTALFVQHAPSLTRHLRRYCDNDAEEFVQEAFLRLHQAQLTGMEIRCPKAWLIQVARNLAIDRRRKRPRDVQCAQEQLEAAAGELSETLSPEAIWLQHEREAAIDQAMQLLSDVERSAIVLRGERLTLKEIGQRLDMDFRRVAEVLNRATRRLAAAHE